LEHAPGDCHHAAVLPDLDPKLHRLPIAIWSATSPGDGDGTGRFGHRRDQEGEGDSELGTRLHQGLRATAKPGDFVMMLYGEGHSRFIWRPTEVTIKPQHG